ncbi:MAG: hypothetical protein COB02_16440 [Candidatus Cloacimonadota bacterium]|nr:MAG: hypothetical protein COB02_16440 [Candidatus Cloacimonadota bacterium]
MEPQKFLTKAESDDEQLLSPDLIRYVQVFSFYALILLLLTFICIWGVDYQKDSVFSTTTGKVEKVISPQGSKPAN